jgi:hypothetical protein
VVLKAEVPVGCGSNLVHEIVGPLARRQGWQRPQVRYAPLTQPSVNVAAGESRW